MFPLFLNIKKNMAHVAQVVSQAQQSKKAKKSPLSKVEPAVPLPLSRFSESVASEAKFNEIRKVGVLGVIKKEYPEFERFAKNYINDDPEILFVSEYIVEDHFAGVLVVWEKYHDSTHYEVFKRNIFNSNEEFDRVLFLDTANLEEEKEHYADYIRDTLNFVDLDKSEYYVMLDTVLKDDRIYEYKISATRVPKNAKEVDYDLILESKGFLNNLGVNATSQNTIFDFSKGSLGSKDLAWAVAMTNEFLPFFGLAAAERPMINFATSENVFKDTLQVMIAKNLNDIRCIIGESVGLFGATETFSHVIDVLGGLPTLFKESFIFGLDETRNVFSYDQFKESIGPKIPVLQRIFEIAESGDAKSLNELSDLSIVTPLNKGTESLSAMVGLSRVFKFVNDYYLAVSYAQERGNIDKIAEIQREVEERREKQSAEDSALQAAKEIRDDIEDRSESISAAISSLFGVDLGKKKNKKDKKRKMPTANTPVDDSATSASVQVATGNQAVTKDATAGNNTIRGVKVF